MLQRLRAMLMKEFIELRRDPWALFRLLVPLLIQVLVYGYAATFTVQHVATVVLDLDRSQASRSLISHFVATGRFDVVEVAESSEQVTRAIDTGKATLALVIHAGFAKELGNGQSAPLQVVVDGTNSNTALIALGYVNRIVGQFQAEAMALAMPARSGAAVPSVEIILQERPWFNPGLDDRWFFIPGVLGTLALVQIINLTSFAVVRERELGTLEQIMVSPITPLEFILGKTIPFFLIGLVDMAVVMLLGILWFRVPFVGNPLVMLAGASLFLLAALGFGLLVSTFARTQQQAFALNFFLINPIFILSGFAFPIAAMPPALQWLTFLNPLRYFLVVIRAIFLKGVGLDILWPDLAALATLAAVLLGLSVLRFSKSLD